MPQYASFYGGLRRFLATIGGKARQARKGATVFTDSGAEGQPAEAAALKDSERDAIFSDCSLISCIPLNDRFAIILPVSIGVGRIGCWFTGCCLGEPSHAWYAMHAADGVSRYPAALVESMLNLLCAALLYWLWRQHRCFGQLFALYLILYGSFRFATEFMRVTPKAFAGWSAYQWMALTLAALGLIAFMIRRNTNFNAARFSRG